METMEKNSELICELEWEIDSHRILFAQWLAIGREDLAAYEDFLIRELTDELAQLYGREELVKRFA